MRTGESSASSPANKPLWRISHANFRGAYSISLKIQGKGPTFRVHGQWPAFGEAAEAEGFTELTNRDGTTERKGGFVPGALYHYLSADHDRLDALLQRAVANPGVIEMEPYADFRKGLLRHIAVEEKIVLPTIQRLQGGRQAAVAGRLRLDHGALVALLVPPPSASIVATIRSILQVHNALEEQKGGLYELCEELAGPDTEGLLGQLRAAPDVPVVPHNERPGVLEATQRAVARAGYKFSKP